MGKFGRGRPDRWEKYGVLSEQIPGTRFIAFKVPLKESLLVNLNPSLEYFGIDTLMGRCPNLGLVIDLTNTDRYYDSTVFQNHNVLHYKLKTFGHVVPADHIYFKFFDAVEEFLSSNKNNDLLIGVHCTHGVNRTGYLIIRYMIQKLNIPPEKAISIFNKARGHSVERENYLDDLKKASWREPPKSTPRQQSLYVATSRNLQQFSRFEGREDNVTNLVPTPYRGRHKSFNHGPDLSHHRSNYTNLDYNSPTVSKFADTRTPRLSSDLECPRANGLYPTNHTQATKFEPQRSFKVSNRGRMPKPPNASDERKPSSEQNICPPFRDFPSTKRKYQGGPSSFHEGNYKSNYRYENVNQTNFGVSREEGGGGRYQYSQASSSRSAHNYATSSGYFRGKKFLREDHVWRSVPKDFGWKGKKGDFYTPESDSLPIWRQNKY